MRIAYYYNQKPRLPASDPYNNPYGDLLCSALERLGVEVEFETQLDDAYLEENRGRIDLLHLNWPSYSYYHDDSAIMTEQMHDFVRRLELARALGYRVVWTAHNIYPHNDRHRSIDHQFRLEICRIATAVIAHCQLAADAVRERFGRQENLFTVPHGHFIGVYPCPINRDQARAQLGIPQDAFVYGFFGSIQPYKGLEQLLQAVVRLPGDDAWLVASGGAKSEEYVQSLQDRYGSHERIRLRAYPRAPSEDIPLVMQASDIIALPFTATTTSGTLTLAMSFGKPVIAPAMGCLPSMATPDSGILYDPGRPDALYEALVQARTIDTAAAGVAALAAIGRFDWESIAAKTLEAYLV